MRMEQVGGGGGGPQRASRSGVLGAQRSDHQRRGLGQHDGVRGEYGCRLEVHDKTWGVVSGSGLGA